MKDVTEVTQWHYGFTYAALLLGFLTAHEFGHYFAARYHGVDATLPYFIPMPIFSLNPFGTFGAVIKTRSQILSRKVLFDIAVSGPVAGFIACLIILTIGFATLPPFEYILTIHPEYAYTNVPLAGMYFGDTILFSVFKDIFSGSAPYIPPMNEVYHYPFLCVGWFGLVVTTLNMLPFGQLDGGHVLYALIGKKQHVVATVLWRVIVVLFFCALISIMHDLLQIPSANGAVMWLQLNIDPTLSGMINAAPWLFKYFTGWIPFAILVRFIIGIKHPVIQDPEPLSRGRMFIGWASLAILILCFAPRFIYFVP
ncbi:MAG: site-2 protease family protein [Ignavibacteria bacterium]|nr:site-2 protease family protein [Ignavibacteria bacterium]